ncbi:MAG: VTT domain-containing protein, partial [Pirellulaceae bacterium]
LGFLPGLLVVNVGLTIAAVIMFLLSRYLVRDAVYSRLGWFIERLNRGLRAGQGGYLLILRLLHAPFTLTNYAVGTTNVGVRQFWWTTQLGLLPGNIAFVLAGASLPSLRELAQQGPWAFVNMPLLIGLTLIGLLPIVIRWGIKRWGLAPGPAN